MASERGLYWSMEKPTDSIDYKSELLDEACFALPEDFEICSDKYGEVHFIKNGTGYQLVTEKDLTPCLVGNEIIRLKRVLH